MTESINATRISRRSVLRGAAGGVAGIVGAAVIGRQASAAAEAPAAPLGPTETLDAILDRARGLWAEWERQRGARLPESAPKAELDAQLNRDVDELDRISEAVRPRGADLWALAADERIARLHLDFVPETVEHAILLALEWQIAAVTIDREWVAGDTGRYYVARA